MEDWIVLHWLELENGIAQYGISALCYTSMYSQKMLGTVWYFNNSITNKKDIFSERKTKTSGLWILDTGPILEGICIGISDELRSEAVNLYLLLNKRGKWSKMFWKTFRLLSNDDNISDCSHLTKREIFWIMVGVNYWSNYEDYADWATWFLWSLHDSWFSHMFSIIWLRLFFTM